ncbi:MAG: sporulation membrane protein YtaF [Candidatus Korobacteraceae bacterium]
MNWATLLPVLLLALSSNGDNIGVGVAYGVRRINVPLASNFIIALITGAGTLISMLLGQTIGNTMQPKLASVLGGTIIAGIGLWVIAQSTRTAGRRENSGYALITADGSHLGGFKKLICVLDNPVSADRDFSRHIDLKEGCLLAVSLSLNNVVNGIAAGIVGLAPALTTVLVMIFSMFTLWGGVAAGSQYGRRWLGNFANLFSGLLLLAIGAYEIAI